MNIATTITRLFTTYYKVSRYLIDGEYIGRIVCVLRSPMDYFSPDRYTQINKEIIALIKQQHSTYGTTLFGLGNLNKMKQLNDGGALISQLVAQDPQLKGRDIRVWTGDTLTAASIYNQLLDIPKLNKLFYIGANGKIGKAVCQLLLENPKTKHVQICIYSQAPSHTQSEHTNITYTNRLSDMKQYKYVVVGKHIPPRLYQQALSTLSSCGATDSFKGTQYLLDYTVPFMPINVNNIKRAQMNLQPIQHLQIGLLKVTNSTFLRGHYDICFGIEEQHIYPCHAGCIINVLNKRKEDETGDIVLSDVAPLWKTATDYGLINKKLTFD